MALDEGGSQEPRSVALRIVGTLGALLILALTTPAGRPFDFCTYYAAGSLAKDRGPAVAYDLEALNQRHQDLHPNSGRRVGSFYYSPLFLVPASLLARLDHMSAQMVNQMLILLALGGIFYLILEQPRPKWLVLMLVLAFIAAGPVRIQFLYQNWTAFLVLLVALALRQTVHGADRSAALLWALAFHLKLYTGLFLVPLCLVGKRRLAATSVALFVLLLALLLPWTGFDASLAYLSSLADEAGGGLTVFRNQISLPAALARLARPPIEWVTSYDPVESIALEAIVWLSLAAFVVVTWKVRQSPARALALTVPYLLLFLPKMWDHGQLLFLTLFVLAVLPRRLEAFAAGYLVLSAAYFPLVEDLLLEVLRGKTEPLQLHALLLFYPLLNLLAAVSLLQPRRPEPSRAEPASP